MTWSNFPLYLLQKLRSEVLLLALASAWALLRLFHAVVGRVEKGKPFVLKVLGVNLVEVGKGDVLHVLRANEEIHRADVLDIHQKGNLTLSKLTVVPDLSKKPRQSHPSNAKEVDIKHGRSS